MGRWLDVGVEAAPLVLVEIGRLAKEALDAPLVWVEAAGGPPPACPGPAAALAAAFLA